MKGVVEKLIKLNKTISTMESCTGGALVNEITNVEGASNVIKFSAVTYSNEYKIKMGVSENIINTYSVYSRETAKEMSKKISDFTNSDYGVGITGKINKTDPNNLVGKDDLIFVSIYDKKSNLYYEFQIEAIYDTRVKNKNMIVNVISDKLTGIIK
ncbi:MAG: nicotinamide-nucleotide amidohydrolase family protein [Firmicutes bacterium]|nr:nicotinamide-nucleotide amidohydrolase family protein [Bacillota bacterium]